MAVSKKSMKWNKHNHFFHLTSWRNRVIFPAAKERYADDAMAGTWGSSRLREMEHGDPAGSGRM